MSQTDRLLHALNAGDFALPPDGLILVLRAEPSDFLRALPAERLRCEQSFRPLHDALAAEGISVAPRLEIGGAALVLVNATRSRAETRGNVARGFGLLAQGGLLLLNGAKTDGIDSLVRQVTAHVPLEGSSVKAHGRVAVFRRPDLLAQALDAWRADAEPSRNAEGYWTGPGMFSPDAADPGSRLLAGALPAGLHGRVADLGAGWGYLSKSCLAACPAVAAIDLYEAEKLALDAARENLSDPRAAFHWADVTRLGRRTDAYDAVVSNPPFHEGRAAEPQIGAAFIAAAARILQPGGRFLMVANRHLPYETQLDASFGHWERLAEDRHFKLVLATRPRRS